MINILEIYKFTSCMKITERPETSMRKLLWCSCLLGTLGWSPKLSRLLSRAKNKPTPHGPHGHTKCPMPIPLQFVFLYPIALSMGHKSFSSHSKWKNIFPCSLFASWDWLDNFLAHQFPIVIFVKTKTSFTFYRSVP